MDYLISDIDKSVCLGSSSRRGLGLYSVYPAYNPFSIYVLVKDNLVFVKYGKNGLIKESCPVRASSLKGMKGSSFQKGRDVNLPSWKRKKLIFPLSPH